MFAAPKQLTWASFWCFLAHRERPWPRLLTRGLAGVEPRWVEHHTVRGGSRVREDGGAGLPSDTTLSQESRTNT